MKQPKRMDQIRAIIQNFLACSSIKKTASQLKISKNTVRFYLRKATELDEDLSQVLQYDDAFLHAVFYPEVSQNEQHRAAIFEENIPGWLLELRRVGVTRWQLWTEYRQDYPDGYGYSQFCDRLKSEVVKKDLTLSITHAPGEKMMVDFAGKKPFWIDRQSGEVHSCEVLLAVMPHSQYTFAIALPSQQILDFVHGLNQALLFFGGTPQVILSDNLKSYVTYADRYEPRFTNLCEQLAAFYHLDLQAARVAKPKDKASVENAVNLAYQRIYAPLRNDEFYSLADLNQAFMKQLILHNETPYKKKPGNRKAIFEAYELPLMRQLPSELFEVKKITSAKVQRNYHVFIGEEKNYYSVHYRYVGKQAEVIYNSRMVEVYIDNQRVAVHRRLFYGSNYQYSTHPDHMPESHREWRKVEGYTAEYFIKEAEKIGPATLWAFKQILMTKIHEAQTYNSCLGILRLGKEYGLQRLENTALRAQKANKASYGLFKRILKGNLDMEADEPEQLSIPFHENIRGADYYK